MCPGFPTRVFRFIYCHQPASDGWTQPNRPAESHVREMCLSPVTSRNRAFCRVPLALPRTGSSVFPHALVHFLLVVLRWGREKRSQNTVVILLHLSSAEHPCTLRLVFPSLRRQFLGDSIYWKNEANLCSALADDIVHTRRPRPMLSHLRYDGVSRPSPCGFQIQLHPSEAYSLDNGTRRTHGPIYASREPAPKISPSLYPAYSQSILG